MTFESFRRVFYVKIIFKGHDSVTFKNCNTSGALWKHCHLSFRNSIRMRLFWSCRTILATVGSNAGQCGKLLLASFSTSLFLQFIWVSFSSEPFPIICCCCCCCFFFAPPPESYPCPFIWLVHLNTYFTYRPSISVSPTCIDLTNQGSKIVKNKLPVVWRCIDFFLSLFYRHYNKTTIYIAYTLYKVFKIT